MSAGKISVVIPAYNEADSLPALMDRLGHVLSRFDGYEILFVDDGSQDETLTVLRGLAAADTHVRFVSLSRNFGHQHALKAGLDHADGDCVISMDADLQHPPELIPEMVARWEDGYEVVQMIRRDDDTPLFKRLTSRLFYRFVNAVGDFKLRPGAADFRLLDRKVVDALAGLEEQTQFLRGTVLWLGFRRCEIEYSPEERAHGRTKYDLRRMMGLALDGVTSSSTRPLRLATILGIVMSGLAMVYIAYGLVAKLILGTALSGWLSLLTGIMLFGGVQLVMLGIIGEYLGKVLLEVKRRPPYVVREQSEPRARSPVADLQARLSDQQKALR